MTPPTDFSDPKLEISSFIREVFGYLKRFKGQLFVLKIEDSLMDNPLFPVLVRDIALLHDAGVKILIVPGTRASIDRQLNAWGTETHFKGGVRLTSEDALPLIYEACCLQLLQAAEDERLPPFVRELCRDYAWRPLDELQRLVSATCSQHHCRDRLLCLSRHLERLLVQSHERTPGMYLCTCLEP